MASAIFWVSRLSLPAAASWLLVTLLVAAAHAQAETPSAAGQQVGVPDTPDSLGANWIKQRLAESSPSVVMITVEGRDGRQAGLGTGFVVDSRGLIATNYHVIGEARPIEVRLEDGRELPVTEVYASDRQLDLAVVRVAAEGLRPLRMAKDEPAMQQGDAVLALGNPMGLRHSVVSGIVSGQRDIEGRRMLQIAIPIEPGNSGGPLLDRDGLVRGIVTMKSAVTANLGFALEVQALRGLLERPNPIPMTRWKTIGSLNPQDWSTVFGSRWEQRAGQILVSEPGDSFGGRSLCLWQRELPAQPHELGVQVRLSDEAGAAGLVWHADGKDRHYGFYPTAGRLRLTLFEGPTVYSWQILEEFTSPHYRPGEWNHLKVRLDGSRAQCFVNDQLVLERTLEGPQSGQIGLAKFRDTQASFRQFRVAPQLAPARLDDERLRKSREQLAAVPLNDWAATASLDTLAADSAAARAVLEQRVAELEDQTQQLRRLAKDVHTREVVRLLEESLAAPPASFDLIRAALLISHLDNPDLEVDAYVQMVDRMAAEVSSAAGAEAAPADRLAALDRYLFQEGGYHGSRTNYYHAANSHLDRVLDDREGLPVTLSVLYMGLARRVGLDVDGVGLPGHFVVRWRPTDREPTWVDPFDGGKRLTAEDIRRFYQVDQGGEAPPDDLATLEPMSPRSVLVRMLRNLLGVAQQNQEHEAMLRYLETLVALAPDDASLRGMRAVVRHQNGRKQAAVEDLDWFLQQRPEGIDPEAIEQLRGQFLRDRQ
jgi:regulator of sirC expression with transglutaminase-like and TPR domain